MTISRGCRSCQSGKWLCIFLTYLCNAHCAFCPAPWKQQDKIVSAFGDDPAAILKRIPRDAVKGISFSGGDCFVVFDRLVDWLSYFKQRRPDIYYWAYTNGLAADESKLKRLADTGLHEIRYNIAATNYDSPPILEQIKMATGLFEKVAVEIPSIPEDYEKVISVLSLLDRMGVAYLNLHEYILNPEKCDRRKNTTGTFLLNKSVEIQYDPRSLKNTFRIRQFCGENSLKIQINNCSLQKKENQMLQRRKTMGMLFRKKYERLTRDGLLETRLTVPYGQQKKLFFLPPMSWDGKRVLLEVRD